MSASTLVPVRPVFQHRYTVIKQLGRGGFGVVEEVVSREGTHFARKTFAPKVALSKKDEDALRKRFIREVQTQQALGGNEIIPVVDHNLAISEPWFVMPLADRTYAQQIDEDRLTGRVEIDPIADILNALSYLHELGYVHRDLNPNNILFHDGRWKLSDFGAVLPPSGQTVTLTDATIIFTEKYCSPEQRQDFHRAQPSSDVYAFGCILHDIFGSYARTPYARHSAEGPIGIVIEKCTEHSPARRPGLRILRDLVLDTLVEQGGQCTVQDAQSQEWLAKLDAIEQWHDSEFDAFARYFSSLNFSERAVGHEEDWVFSLSTPFLTRLPTKAFERIVSRADGVAEAIIEKYCEWVSSTRFLFHFSDTVSSRLETIFSHGTPAVKALAFIALVNLAHSHNRWYIMRCVVALCRRDKLSREMAQRLVIELRTAEKVNLFKSCVRTIDSDVDTLAPELAKLC